MSESGFLKQSGLYNFLWYPVSPFLFKNDRGFGFPYICSQPRLYETPCPADLGSKQWAIYALVAHTGFEPVISSLRGRCPRPLDECARHETDPKSSQPSYLKSLSYPDHKGQALEVLKAIIIPWITLLVILSLLKA